MLFPFVGICTDSTLSKKNRETVLSEKRYELNINTEIATVYNFRGENIFKATPQQKKHGVFSPSIIGSILAIDLWLKYAGYYQLNSENQGYNVNIGKGHEQNLFLGWDYTFTKFLTFNSYLAYYFYPFSMKEMTGVRNPSYVETLIGMLYNPHGIVDVALNISYYHGVQSRIKNKRYVYFNPSIRKRFDFEKRVSFELKLDLGYKLFNDRKNNKNYVYDADFVVGVPINIVSEIYINPAIHLSWANQYDVSFGNESFVWFGVDVGVIL